MNHQGPPASWTIDSHKNRRGPHQSGGPSNHPGPSFVEKTPQSGYEQAKSVLQVLAATARKEFDFGAFACFGTNAEVTVAGTINVGDTLIVLG